MMAIAPKHALDSNYTITVSHTEAPPLEDARKQLRNYLSSQAAD